jgi:hypothetical protein
VVDVGVTVMDAVEVSIPCPHTYVYSPLPPLTAAVMIELPPIHNEGGLAVTFTDIGGFTVTVTDKGGGEQLFWSVTVTVYVVVVVGLTVKLLPLPNALFQAKV